MNALLQVKNRETLRLAKSIFQYDRLSWLEVKKLVTAENVKAFYTAYGELWPIDTQPQDYLTAQEGLVALYLGDIEADKAIRPINSAALYAEQIIVTDPIQPVWCMRAENNPIEHPVEFLLDTLKVIRFLFLLGPAIEAGYVQLFPNPGFFDHDFRQNSWSSANKRFQDYKKDPKMMAALHENMEDAKDSFKISMFHAPEHWIKSKLQESGISARAIKKEIKAVRRMRKEDPLLLPSGDMEEFGAQYNLMRSGLNLEDSLWVSQLTGAFPVTYNKFKWEELKSVKEELDENSFWAEVGRAIQELTLGFLNTEDSSAIVRVRDEGKLANFRSLLLQIKQARQSGESLSDSAVRDIKDQLLSAYQSAEHEYKAIDQKILQNLLATVGVTTLIKGVLNVDFGVLAGSTMNLVRSLLSSTQARKAFNSTSPMSMFVELSKKKFAGIEY